MLTNSSAVYVPILLFVLLPSLSTFVFRSCIKLGAAGGPLLVAMVLGTLGRTGPLVWNLPYSANLTLRQVGFILFLAGVGTRSGYAFVTTFVHGNGLPIFAAGALIVFVVSILTLWIGYK